MSKQSDLVSVSQGSGGDPLYIDTTNDRVGVGTSSPLSKLSVQGDGTTVRLDGTANTSRGIFMRNVGTAEGYITTDGNMHFLQEDAGRVMKFSTANTERMRITSSGNLLVGKTADDITVVGAQVQADGALLGTRANGQPMTLNRTSSDGDIAQFRKDGSTVGSISTEAAGNQFQFNAIGANAYVGITWKNEAEAIFFLDTHIRPGTNKDNVYDIGRSDARFDDIYATNGTIQTSDRNEKQDIEALSDAEQRVAVAAKGLLRKYRWKDAVAEKGDAARIHFGIIAQDLQAAFEAEGLDAGRYGMFISSTWWEAEVEKTREVEQEDGTTITETYTATETYDEPTEGATERTRLGVRYPELLAFIIAAL